MAGKEFPVMGKKKSRARQFTEGQINRFKADPNVRDIDKRSLRFKYAFRVKMYEAWEKEGRQGVKRVLSENGYDLKELGSNFIDHLCNSFRHHGRPSNAKEDNPVGCRSYYRADKADDEYLLGTGKFRKYRNGIAFTEEFQNDLFSAYPEQSIEDGLRKAGIDPLRVGYQRIYTLKRLFDGGRANPEKISYSDEIVETYNGHPYIESITTKKLRFSKAFFNEALFLIEIMNIDEILKLYEIEPADLPVSVRVNLSFRLRSWKRTDDRCTEVSEQRVRIQYRRYQKLFQLREERFRRIREEELPQMSLSEKKQLCQWIQGYPADPMRVVSTEYLLKKIGISHSSYYSILRDDHYGMAAAEKDEQDERDIKVIRRVMEYRGFRKGTRQIYMMMPDVTGDHFSRNKIRRLMKKFDVHSGLRERKQSRIDARKLLEEHKKDNLLKRRFRLARPNEHILTDVTYIHYGDNKLAYGSASIDAVTGRLYNFSVSESNDLQLVISTVDALDGIEMKPGAIFHSDQGVLYLNETFQKRIEKLGLRQSMSKRGNCWDNAPQESFFGHFKDECGYQGCETFEDLAEHISEYAVYYNNERRQWNRNRMTPVQYEKYLNELSEEEFNEYLRAEEARYQAMKDRAADEAKQRGKTLGV